MYTSPTLVVSWIPYRHQVLLNVLSIEYIHLNMTIWTAGLNLAHVSLVLPRSHDEESCFGVRKGPPSRFDSQCIQKDILHKL